MKKLAVTVWIAVVMFGLFGVAVLYAVPLRPAQLTDGYGVSYTATVTAER